MTSLSDNQIIEAGEFGYFNARLNPYPKTSREADLWEQGWTNAERATRNRETIKRKAIWLGE